MDMDWRAGEQVTRQMTRSGTTTPSHPCYPRHPRLNSVAVDCVHANCRVQSVTTDFKDSTDTGFSSHPCYPRHPRLKSFGVFRSIFLGLCPPEIKIKIKSKIKKPDL